jgi:hypothetical protein
MTEKTSFKLDAALAALKQDERAVLPVTSESLRTRVLADAAMVAAGRTGAVAVPPRKPTLNQHRGQGRPGGLRLFGLFDVWSGAAVAAVALCLAVGLGIGFGSGPEVMNRMGLSNTIVAFAADQGDGFFQSEDVL